MDKQRNLFGQSPWERRGENEARLSALEADSGGGGEHPDLAAHDTLGLATQAELDAHAATSHGTAHPDLAAHDTLGLATQTELNAHAAAGDPHPVYALGDHAHGGVYAPEEHDHPHNHDVDIEDAVGVHEAAANPHPTYATDADLTAHAADTTSVHGIADTTALATDAEVATAITNHEAAANPHAGYATDADLTAHAATSHGGTHPDLAAHDTLGLATDIDLVAHAGAADPHTGYQKESEKGAANGYAELSAATVVPTAQLGSGTASSTTFLRGDNTWGILSSGAPGSTLGYAEVTVGQGGITTLVDLTNLSVTVTVPAGRRIRVTGHARHFASTVADNRILFVVREGSTTLNEVQLLGDPSASASGSGGQVMWVGTPSAGAHTYKLSAASVDGGTASITADPTFPTFILVEDITGSVWPEGEAVTAGMIASEPWQPWTPTLDFITVGNGTMTARYQRIGRTIHWNWMLLFGSTTAFANATIKFGLPVAANIPVLGSVGAGWAYDSDNGANARVVHGLYDGAGKVQPMTDGFTSLRTSQPFTWAAGDVLALSGTYEAAS